tara:strand:- start:18 stop:536 length:519 start_codon:yes stop_codon:yes gene_type:complete
MGTLNLGSTGTINATTKLSLGIIPCFNARLNSGSVFTTDGISSPWTPIPFTHVDVNRGGCYSTNDGKFTCTLAGVYKFDVSLISGNTNHWFRGYMFHQPGGSGTPNAIQKSQTDYNGNSSLDYTHCGFSIIYPCAVGDKVWVSLDTSQLNSESVYHGESGLWSQWNGMFVSA